MVQSGSVPKPWQDLLDLIAPLPQKTKQEVVAGRMALLRHAMEEEKSAYKTMVDWGTFDVEVQGYAGSADADMLFRLEDFIKINDHLVTSMAAWNIQNVKAAAVRMNEDGKEIIRVKAITSAGNVVFDEPAGDPFPSEELMTKLQMINPGDA